MSKPSNRFFGHNFGTVFRFEVVRILKKKSFWLSILAFPVLIVGVFGIIFLSNMQSEKNAADLAQQKFSIGITDESKLLTQATKDSVSAEPIDNKNDGIDKVKSGQIDAYFYYPSNLAENKVEVYGKSIGIFENSRYGTVAKSLLKQSIAEKTSPDVIAVWSDRVGYNDTTYRDGEVYNPLMDMIVPGIFLVLLYVIIAIFGNQMLNATIEEKENRVMEIILTTIKSRTLIAGKIFAMMTLILIQMIVIIGFVLVGYLLLKDHLALPNIDLSQIPFDWPRIFTAFLLFSGSILFLSGSLVAIGAAMPTAKEASQFFGIIMVFMFAPLYAAPLFVTSPESPVVIALSFFPPTAPIPLLLRNAVGNLTPIETIAGVVMLLVFACIIFLVAARLFQTGAVEYDKKMSLKNLFK